MSFKVCEVVMKMNYLLRKNYEHKIGSILSSEWSNVSSE